MTDNDTTTKALSVEDMLHGITYDLQQVHSGHFMRVRDILHTNVADFEEQINKLAETIKHLDLIDQADPDTVKMVERQRDSLQEQLNRMLKQYRRSLENAIEMVDNRIERYTK